MPYISVVTPVYNAVNIVDELYARLVENLEKITNDFEIIMVNDACPQDSGSKIAALAQKDKRVKLIDLARNFGQHIAISAGLDYAEGDYVVVMDCDLQDPPDKIELLLRELIKSGKEVIFAIREHRKEGFLKRFYSKFFQYIMGKLTEDVFKCDEDVGNFSIITRKVVLEVRKLRELKRNYGSLVRWCGFKSVYIPVEVEARFEGQSSYTFFKSLKHALGIMLQQSAKPLYISIFFCLLSFIIACLFAVIILYNYFSGNYTVNGYAGIMFALSLMSSMIFFTLAIISIYIANVFHEQHHRPLYVIERSINIEEK